MKITAPAPKCIDTIIELTRMGKKQAASHALLRQTGYTQCLTLIFPANNKSALSYGTIKTCCYRGVIVLE